MVQYSFHTFLVMLLFCRSLLLCSSKRPSAAIFPNSSPPALSILRSSSIINFAPVGIYSKSLTIPFCYYCHRHQQHKSVQYLSSFSTRLYGGDNGTPYSSESDRSNEAPYSREKNRKSATPYSLKRNRRDDHGIERIYP